MKWMKLGDVAEVIAGQSPKSEFYNKEGEGIPFFQGKADFGDKYPTVTTWCTKPTKIAKEGDILFSVRAPVGPTNIAKLDCCVGRGLAAIRVSTQIERSYLRYYFKKVEQKISDSGRGSTFNSITQKDLKSLQIPLPSLSEQRAIVEKLDRAQRLIDIDREMLQRYDALIQSVFLEMFGDPVRNPKGWEVRKLGEISKVRIGPFGSLLHKDDYVQDGTPLINPKHIIDSKIKIQDGYCVPDRLIKDLNKYVLKTGDIVLARRGEMGRCAVISDSENGYLCGTGSMYIRPKAIEPNYISLCLGSESMVSYLEDVANGVTMKNLNAKIVSNILLPIPPLEKQKDFRDFLIKIDAEKDTTDKVLTKSESLFSSLVQQAFSKN